MSLAFFVCLFNDLRGKCERNFSPDEWISFLAWIFIFGATCCLCYFPCVHICFLFILFLLLKISLNMNLILLLVRSFLLIKVNTFFFNFSLNDCFKWCCRYISSCGWKISMKNIPVIQYFHWIFLFKYYI